MNPRQKALFRLLSWLSALGLGVALAAALFNPDYVDPNSLVTQPIGWVGAPTASGYKLDGTQQAFLIDYSSLDWSGNLHSRDISSAGELSNLDNWDGGAREQIESQANGIGPARRIVTMNGATGVPFRWASLSTAQKTALDPATASDASSSPVLDYIRGSHANEAPNGNNYRARDFVLGDIIHSTPRHWGDTGTVFVGANDGMLHAINTADGTERFAFIPSQLIGKLPSLLVTPYKHTYFVDGQIAARKFGSQSILVAGLGGGGKGLFGLDVTTVPTDESNAATKVLWEITNTGNFANLGHTYGSPVLTHLPDGTNVAIVANGYNNTGNGHAVLYLIDPATGARIDEIDTGSGTTSSPNGLSSPTVVGDEVDGKADFAYAGDIDGNLWKFDLTTRSATLLYRTNPAQAITMAPGVKPHPLGGYMVTFVTGRIFEAADEGTTTTHYAYGIWDRPQAYADNDTLLTQTLTEANYTGASPAVRVRTATDNQPDWTPGSGHHMGWKVALPIGGERVVGDGAYITGTRFFFMTTNPTINPNSFPPFENWWMQLNYLTGGDIGAVWFDLNSDNAYTDLDKVGGAYPVGRYMGGGRRSQLTEFSTASYERYIGTYDTNTDHPVVSTTGVGVAGGHFDYDSYFGTVTSAAVSATATITVGTTGQVNAIPATLGAISVDGVTVVPGLSVSDIVDGTATVTNATTIASKVGNGFTATQSGSVITIKAPAGVDYNGKTISIADGTSSTPLQVYVPAVPEQPEVQAAAPPPGTLKITGIDGKATSFAINCGGDYIGSTAPFAKPTDLDALYSRINSTSYNGYGVLCTKTTDDKGKTNSLVCTITSSKAGESACPTAFTATGLTVDAKANTGLPGGVNYVPYSPGSPAIPQSGWTNFKPALTATAFSGGADGSVAAFACNGKNGNCTATKHLHQYDDIYDRTGVNMLDASETQFNLAQAIPSTSTRFKIIASNQYLSPAVKIHLNGSPAYQYNVDAGYTPIKNFLTTSTLDVATLPTYSRASTDTYQNGVKVASSLRSFAINMPVTAFSIVDWWGGALGLPADPRAGLHPTQTGCVNTSANVAQDGIMYQPVIPPGAGDGYTPAVTNIPSYGLVGYSASTTESTAKGVRHNGALTLQVIKDTTPNSALEMSIPNHPEFGWRVKAGDYRTYVLVEYTIFWHHPNKFCFGQAGWVKDPPPEDDSKATAPTATNLAIAAAHSDPKIGTLGPSGLVAGTTTSVVSNPDGTTTTTTVTVAFNPDGSATITTTVTNSGGGSTTTVVDESPVQFGGPVDAGGHIDPGVTTPTDAIGRVNWRELFKQ